MRRYKHNLSHTRLHTCDMGKLVPIACVEALAGDTIQHSSNVLIRVSPLAAPIMHNVTARIHHFFAPSRLLWDGWEDFITGGPDGMDAQTLPKITTDAATIPGSLLDHLGIPPVSGIEVNSLPLIACNRIYNEFYRDQDLVTERAGLDVTLPNVAWEKDYLTTARPFTQKGPQVTIPLGDAAPVEPVGVPSYSNGTANTVFSAGTGGSTGLVSHSAGEGGAFAWDDPGLIADLSSATGADINDVRKAFAIQRYQEARARYGSRYTEYLRYLGENPKDQRLQRPEFLGGGSTSLNFSEVMQTANGNDPRFGVADLYGHGIAAMRSNRYRRHMEEHGFIISFLSVRPRALYTEAINRQWLRTEKEDFYQHELAQIGQQEVFNNEVQADVTDGTGVFGYSDRYAEYREHPSTVHGEFRDTLDYWHMGREFATPPALNQSFTDCVPTKRIHNEQTQDALWIKVQNKMVARRIVPRNASPRVL